MKKLFFVLALVIFIFIPNSCSDDDNNNGFKSTTSTVDILDLSFTNVMGKSTLVRNEDNIKVTFKTSDLTPGYVYTIWWVIWNKPENCTVPGACSDADFAIADLVEVEVLAGSGLEADATGAATFTATLNANDITGSYNVPFGLPAAGGLQDTQHAEVHIVLRSHGPKIPGQFNEQLTTYEGGCTTFFDPFTEVPDAEGECGDIQAAVHPPK